MTVKEFLADQLVSVYMLWPDQAQTIVDAFVDSHLTFQEVKWGDPVDGYPPQLLTTVFYLVKQNAIEWLEANWPDHIALIALKN